MQVINSYNLYEVESIIVFNDYSTDSVRMLATGVNETDAKLCVKEFIEQFNKDIIKGVSYQVTVRKTCFIKKEEIK